MITFFLLECHIFVVWLPTYLICSDLPYYNLVEFHSYIIGINIEIDLSTAVANRRLLFINIMLLLFFQIFFQKQFSLITKPVNVLWLGQIADMTKFWNPYFFY